MKNLIEYVLLSFCILMGVSSLNPAYGLQEEEKAAYAALSNVDAIQAMALANQWNWTHREIKSHVTTREVVFEFSNGIIKKIPLPEDKMPVAVAPYIKETHG